MRIVDRSTARIRSPAILCLESFQRRGADGLLTGRPHSRSDYVVTRAGPSSLDIRAADGWTAINVGLNAQHSAHMIPSLSVNQNLELAWGMVLFWGFAWPWLLIALHRRPLRCLTERLIGEVDAAGVPVGSTE